MEFLKELLVIQNEVIVTQVSDKLLSNEFEKEQFIDKYVKRNYCLVKVCNCKMDQCVKKKDILSILS